MLWAVFRQGYRVRVAIEFKVRFRGWVRIRLSVGSKVEVFWLV